MSVKDKLTEFGMSVSCKYSKKTMVSFGWLIGGRGFAIQKLCRRDKFLLENQLRKEGLWEKEIHSYEWISMSFW